MGLYELLPHPHWDFVWFVSFSSLAHAVPAMIVFVQMYFHVQKIVFFCLTLPLTVFLFCSATDPSAEGVWYGSLIWRYSLQSLILSTVTYCQSLLIDTYCKKKFL